MRIIIVTDYPNINGGAGKVALESAIALVPHVESVHVFTTIGEVPPELASQVSISTLGQSKVTELPLSESMIGGLWNKQAAQAFSDLLDGYDPADTLVHIHSWRDATTSVVLALDVPTVNLSEKRGLLPGMPCRCIGQNFPPN